MSGFGARARRDEGAIARGIVIANSCDMRALTLLAVLAAGCTQSGLCTSPACAANPCTPGCVFVEPGGACPATVDEATVRACSSFCGLQTINPAGCLRYRSEDPACPTWCTAWGDPRCWAPTPAIDYVNGGAICATGVGCYGGALLDDLSIPCFDFGHVDGAVSD
jgi:hypothetical protein